MYLHSSNRGVIDMDEDISRLLGKSVLVSLSLLSLSYLKRSTSACESLLQPAFARKHGKTEKSMSTIHIVIECYKQIKMQTPFNRKLRLSILVLAK